MTTIIEEFIHKRLNNYRDNTPARPKFYSSNYQLIHRALNEAYKKFPNDTVQPILQFKDAFYGHFDIEGEIIDIPPPKYMSDRISAKGRKITGTANTRYKDDYELG